MGEHGRTSDGAKSASAGAKSPRPRRGRLRTALPVVALVALAFPALLVGGCVYSCAFVPRSPADLPQSVGVSHTVRVGSSAVSSNAQWRDTVAEAESARSKGSPAIEVVEDFPDAGEALVVQPTGSPSCPAVRMVTYASEGGRYAVTGYWGASTARPGARDIPIVPLYDYTTAEVVAESLVSCLAAGSPCAFGVSVDPAVRDLTVGGASPTWVREVGYDGGTCYVWCYEGMDVPALFSAAGVDPSGFTLRQVIDGLGVRVGDEAPY
ncbi:hypothetical protein [Olsenella sp. Marseille-P4559]|uniref:hypothetical protein n=1 Tax=Olsenella sp. Marseille-P4559 TaxID=2364795 RepID=UPI001031EC4B|nr:hypothetical protein [Olsenella sp. Marseille-P4559]